jgi:hypothetical protein
MVRRASVWATMPTAVDGRLDVTTDPLGSWVPLAHLIFRRLSVCGTACGISVDGRWWSLIQRLVRCAATGGGAGGCIGNACVSGCGVAGFRC